jgi:hypothetical protein
MQCHISVSGKPPSKDNGNLKPRRYFENSGYHSGAAEDSGLPTSETVVGQVIPADVLKDRSTIKSRTTSQPTAHHHTLEDQLLKKLFLLVCLHYLLFENWMDSFSRNVGKELPL